MTTDTISANTRELPGSVKPLPDPPQPSESAWTFVEDLQKPLWRKVVWISRETRKGEVSLASGIRMEIAFKDPEMLLATAYDDLRAFLEAHGIEQSGSYRLVFCRNPALAPEAYRISIGVTMCEIAARDTEGLRRAIFFLEDEMLRLEGPFLPLGTIERAPVIRTRISRCFFGPIHRPPKNRDELTDEVNYYPDEYLNRLAHEAVNGLWLTVHFDEVCRSAVLPETGRNPELRLNKLRQTVAQCARYGIKIYLFTNEPIPLWPNGPVGKAHPELLGNIHGDRQRHYFCTSSQTGQAYLEEALYNLFTDVPGLGGIIDITIGEGGTHCCSGLITSNTCPRCSKRDPHEVFREAVDAMRKGMYAANPEAEFISWPYGQYTAWGDHETVASAGRLPTGVTLLHNFESSAEAEQCGRLHKIQDYWLSFIGPSQLFVDCAKAAVGQGNRMAAKLQVGCSHEVATVPYVPVPGHLYRKYKSLHELGVSTVMQCWYFGNYPGLMTRAAGELSFAPLPASEEEFLLGLASRDWGAFASEVVHAWKYFQEGYSSFPLNHVFGWFGPVHDAPTWPWYLEPVDLGISPSYLLAAPSGDRFGECFAYTHSISDILELTRKMADEWERGAAILRRLRPAFVENEERRKDIGVAMALGIQFESAANMLEFYALREELPYVSSEEGMAHLARMRFLVLRELERDEELLALCEDDSRLGFHSEAEGYKYFPAKIRWRMAQLGKVLEHGFPKLKAELLTGNPLWPQYTGRQPKGVIYSCHSVSEAPAIDGDPTGPVWNLLESEELSFAEYWPLGEPRDEADPAKFGLRASWKACRHRDALYLGVECYQMDPGGEVEESDDILRVLVAPRRLWPAHAYQVSSKGSKHLWKYPVPSSEGWDAATRSSAVGWSATLRIPFSILSEEDLFDRPLRIDVERVVKRGTTLIKQSWIKRNPWPHRLVFATANPADMGWLILS